MLLILLIQDVGHVSSNKGKKKAETTPSAKPFIGPLLPPPSTSVPLVEATPTPLFLQLLQHYNRRVQATAIQNAMNLHKTIAIKYLYFTL